MEYLHTDTNIDTIINNTVTGLLQKYINILFLKSSTFIASITAAGELFHILKVDRKKECR